MKTTIKLFGYKATMEKISSEAEKIVNEANRNGWNQSKIYLIKAYRKLNPGATFKESVEVIESLFEYDWNRGRMVIK